MAAMTPAVIQLFSRWGCVSAAVGVFGATGGKKHQYNRLLSKSRLLHSFSLQPTEDLTPEGLNAPTEVSSDTECSRNRNRPWGRMARTGAWDGKDSEDPCILTPQA